MNNSNELNNNTRKEEILAMSRQSNEDEGVGFAESKGRKYLSAFMLAVVIVPLMFLARFSDMHYAFEMVMHTMVVTIFSVCIAEPISAYRFTKEKNHLSLVIVYAVLVIFSTSRLISILTGLW